MVKLSDAMSRKKTPPEPPPRKPGRPPRVGGPKGLILTLRGEAAYKAWLEEAAEHCGLTMSAFMDAAAAAYARSKGFKKKPPER